MNRSIHDIAAALAAPDTNIGRPATENIDPQALASAVGLFRSIVFGGYFDSQPVGQSIRRLIDTLANQMACAYVAFGSLSPAEARTAACVAAESLAEALPELRRRLGTDVSAVFDGDPAARSHSEVIMCYPAITAMTHYRLAHELFTLGVPVVPRMITEAAHSLTGIDIHPAACIGERFAIDHGTGVVIGETCIIGRNVRLYQGVTLGAKSFKFDAEGNILSEPRHPILEENVVVYSNSSILGRVRIGHDSIIGGNVWQTTDLPPYSRVVQGRAGISTFGNSGGI